MTAKQLGGAIWLAGAIAVLPAAARAQSWQGTLHCEPVAGHFGHLSIPMVITQSGAALSYRREMLTPAGGPSGTVELGRGTLDGAMVDITGTYAARGEQSVAHYTGRVRNGNRVMRLTGEQVWTFDRNRATFHRPCHITLRQN